MAKAKPHVDQLGFDWESPTLPKGEAALAGLEERLCRLVGKLLATEHALGRPREVVAARMTVLLGEEVTRAMLDADSSPARADRKVPASRLLALLAVTARHDLFDPVMRETGAAIITGDEVNTARIGHLRRQKREIDDELRALERTAPAIREGGTNGQSRR